VKISIITPSYNQAGFIGKCIDSVRNQTGDISVEHIILDNCSSDGTAALLAEYQANPGAVDVKIVIEPDEGQAAAINKGFGMATGEVVCWLNTDEYYAEGTLTRVVKFFAEHPEIDVIFGDCDFVDKAGMLVKRKREYFFSESMLLYYGCFIPTCATFIRHRVIDKGVLLNSEFRVIMDCDWYIRIAKAGYRFAHIPCTLASFTWHENNISIRMAGRRKRERRLLQDSYSNIKWPRWIRTVIYGIMYRFWLAVRVFRRLLAKL